MLNIQEHNVIIIYYSDSKPDDADCLFDYTIDNMHSSGTLISSIDSMNTTL